MIQGLKRLITLRQPHVNLGANRATIKGMRRLPKFEHDVIRGVHHIRDGAEARRLQAHLHRIWGCADLDAINDTKHHSRGESCIIHGQ